MTRKYRISLLTVLLTSIASAQGGSPSITGRLYALTARASAINPLAKEYPELGYVFADDKGKAKDVQTAMVDTRVPSRGKLVIWMMSSKRDLFESITSYGLHVIQPHYANGWFSKIAPVKRDDGNTLGNLRLEAATGEDHSPIIAIAKPDGAAARSIQFVKWLVKEHPEGNWKQFLTADQSDLRWEHVILSGSSHGSTTSARWAKHQKVSRVVMFCGPRDQLESWQGLPTATPPNRLFGFSHVLDSGWVGDHYCRSWQLLGLAQSGPIVNVDDAKAPFGNSRRLITNCDVKGDARRAHGVVASGKSWDSVWRYMYTYPVELTGKAVASDPDCRMDLR